MTELQLIQSTLIRAARRRRWQRAWTGFWQGLLVGACLWLATLFLYKIYPLPFAALGWAGLLAGLAMLTGLAIGALRPLTLLETARWVDERERLQERLSTALEVASAPRGEWRELVVGDAARHAGQLNVRRMLPYHLPPASRWALVVLALGSGLGFVPEYRSKAYWEKQREAEVVRDTGKHLAELTRRSLARRPPAMEPVRQSLESVADLGDLFAKARLTRADALRDLAKVTDQLKEQTQQLTQGPALKRLEQAARSPSGASAPSLAELQKQIDALQKSLGSQAAQNPEALDRLQKALEQARAMAANLAAKEGAAGDAAKAELAKALNELAQQAQELGLNLDGLNEAIAALAASQMDRLLKDLDTALLDLDKLQALAQALKELQARAAEIGKDLAEQLENGQAEIAQNTLRRMANRLNSADLSDAELQKLLDEVRRAIGPAAPYGKVADYLQQAARQMQQGDKPGAAESLAAAAKELENLLQQLADAESLRAALKACEKAGLCLSTCQSWGQCPFPGLNPGFKPGNGKPGRGVGTWSDASQWFDNPPQNEPVDNSGIQRPDFDPRGLTDRGDGRAPDNLTPTKVRGQFSPGGPMPSITLRGVSIKGQSTVHYQQAVAAAQSDAEAALSQERVPRAYQGAVKDYFDDLKP